MRDDRVLRWITAGFVAAAVVHAADHQRRGLDTVSTSVQALGTLGFVLTAAIAASVFVGHRLAPVVAASGGFALSIGFLAVHWLPDWGEFSDPLVIDDAEWLSRGASLLEIAGALAMALAAVALVRRRGGLSSMRA